MTRNQLIQKICKELGIVARPSSPYLSKRELTRIYSFIRAVRSMQENRDAPTAGSN